MRARVLKAVSVTAVSVSAWAMISASPALAQTTSIVAYDTNVTVDLSVLQDGGKQQRALPTMDGTGESVDVNGTRRLPGPKMPVSTLHIQPEGPVPTLPKPAPKLRPHVAEAPSMDAPAPVAAPDEAPQMAETPVPASEPEVAEQPAAPVVAETPKAAPEAAPAPVVAEAPKAEPVPTPEIKPIPEPKIADAAPVAPAPAAPEEPAVTAAPEPKEPSVAALPAPEADPAAMAGDSLRILFPAEVSKLPDTARDPLKVLAERLKADDTLRLQLLAYGGDAETPASTARRLSLARALEVRTYLIENGVRSTRIDVRALGNKTTGPDSERVDVSIIQR